MQRDMSISPTLAGDLLPWNVVFGIDSAQKLPQLIDEMGFGRALILSTPGRAQQALELNEIIAGRGAAVFDKAAAHVPKTTIDAALAAARDCRADCCISIGGGATNLP